MSHYLAYPTVKDMPSRKQRKGRRRVVYETNKVQAAVERKERREARKKLATEGDNV